MLAPAVNNQPDPPTATMLGELAYESERVADLASLTASVVAGYVSAGVVLDPRRLWLDSAAKRLAEVARSACAAVPDRATRAARHLVEVEDLLEAGPDSLR